MNPNRCMNPTRCEVCGQTVPTELSLRLHLRNVHQQEATA